jgi:hypothetical protein
MSKRYLQQTPADQKAEQPGYAVGEPTAMILKPAFRRGP